MKRIRRLRGLLLSGAACLALTVLTPLQPAAAEPPDGTANVGTAVHVVMHQSFTETTDSDQCAGAAALAAIHRGASVILAEPSADSSNTPTVAVGGFFRSRLNAGACEVLYIISAPAMASFNVQFFDQAGGRSPTFGPVRSDPVTDQPGILQAVRVDLGV